MTVRPVVVVSSSKVDRDRTCAVVVSLGYEALPVENSEQCLDLLEKTTPLAVMVDLWMSPDRGDECCRLIKENFGARSVPVIITSDSEQPHEVMYCWRAAAEDFLPKPVDAARLKPKLDALATPSDGIDEASTSLTGTQVLFAEPSRFFRKMMGENLQHSGVSVLYAMDGEEALDLANEHAGSLDACLIDMNLSGLDGLEVANELVKIEALQGKPLLMFTNSETSAAQSGAVERITGSKLMSKRELPFDLILSRVHGRLREDGVNLRAAERMPFFSLVEFSVDQRNWATGFTYDVSAGGLFIRTLTPAPAQSPVHLRFRFVGQSEPSLSTGVVSWANPYRPRGSFCAPLGMGIHLTQMAPELWNQVSGLVAKGRPATNAGLRATIKKAPATLTGEP